MNRLRLGPAAERTIDGGQRDIGKLLAVLGQDLRVARTIIVPRLDLLRLRRVEEVQIGFGGGAGFLAIDILVDDRHRRLGQDRARRIEDFVLVASRFLQDQMGFVLPRQQHVADAALGEGHRRTTRARIQHRHILVEIGNERLGLVSIAAGLLGGIVPGRQIGPAGAPRCLGIGRDHLDVRLHQIVPVPDLLGIAFAHQKNDGRGVGRGILRQAFLPVGPKQLAVLGNRVEVGGQSQRDNISLQPVDHRAGLRARTAMAVGDGDIVALGFLLCGKSLVDLLVQSARRVIADIQQLDIGSQSRVSGKTSRGRGKHSDCGQKRENAFHGLFLRSLKKRVKVKSGCAERWRWPKCPSRAR